MAQAKENKPPAPEFLDLTADEDPPDLLPATPPRDPPRAVPPPTPPTPGSSQSQPSLPTTAPPQPRAKMPPPTPASFKRKAKAPLRPLPHPAERQDQPAFSFEQPWYGSDSDDSDAFPTPDLAQLTSFPSLNNDDYIDHLYTAQQPAARDDHEIIRSLVDTIPLESDDEDAPVGVRRRRIAQKQKHKKMEVDHETGFGISTFDHEDDADQDGVTGGITEEEIERDRRKIERAAKNLGCKKTAVVSSRWEEVVAGGDRAEAAVTAETVDPEAEKPKNAGSILDVIAGDNDSDDEDLVLGDPNRPKTPEQPRSQESAVVTMSRAGDDEMEVIQGEDLGRVINRQYKEIKEEKIRWRVPGMKSPLLDHQCLGVSWMLQHEMNSRRPRGGLVADVMGLGKTIQAISVMILNPPRLPSPEEPNPPQVTLIVCPVALLQQWKDEIETHCKKNAFRVFINHGPHKIKKLEDLEKQDVILCSYATIMNSCPNQKIPRGEDRMAPEEYNAWWAEEWRKKRGIFHRMKFWRVILDESHIIRNRRSRTSFACQKLDAEITWCLSGTPIQNKLEDIYPVFAFLKHPQAGYLNVWKDLVDHGSEDEKCRRVQVILRSCFMRRSKNDILVGKPLITLPKKRVRMVELEFGLEERALYTIVEGKTRDTINKLLRKKVAQKSYSHILTLLLRLRQICNHPYLILDSISEEFSADNIDDALKFLEETKAENDDADDPDPSDRSSRHPSPPSTLTRILQTARDHPKGQTETCNLCYTPVIAPCMSRCRHVFCRDCISDLFSTDLSPTAPKCPRCHSPLHESDIRDIPTLTPATRSTDADWLAPFEPFTHSAKTLALRDQLLQWARSNPREKIVLFSQFVRMLDIVERVVEQDDIPCVRYQGSMTLPEREDALATFRHNPDVRIMLTSIKAGGVGLNLTCASLVVSLDLWWNAATELQAFDRVHRLGQQKEVFVTRMMVKNTVEERILKLQERKLLIAKAAMGEGGTGVGRLTLKELLGLFGRVEDGQVREDHGGQDLMGRAREVARGRRERGVRERF